MKKRVTKNEFMALEKFSVNYAKGQETESYRDILLNYTTKCITHND